MAKPILILQLRPEDITAASEYACFLRYGGLDVDQTQRIRIEQSGIPEDIDLDDYAAVIVGGSPFDISTPAEQKSDIQLKIEDDFERLLGEIIARDFPFLGACSGNGLLGNHLGSPITKRYGEAVSCVPVTLTDAGRKDKLLSDFPDEIYVLLGHKEACDETPADATLLITGKNCPVQMFRVGENVYATQFHPEADANEFAIRIDTYANHGYFPPQAAALLKRETGIHSTPYSQEILRRFVSIYLEKS